VFESDFTVTMVSRVEDRTSWTVDWEVRGYGMWFGVVNRVAPWVLEGKVEGMFGRLKGIVEVWLFFFLG
jgi:hypothetical protein